MTKLLRTTAADKAGMAPGTLIYIGEPRDEPVLITVLRYDSQRFEEYECKSAADALALCEPGWTTWINVDGLHDPALVGTIGERFGVHPLIMEDILNTEQRPKVDDGEDGFFVLLKMIDAQDDGVKIVSEQVSLIVRNGVVVSFQERRGDVFDAVRERLRTNKGRVRRKNADYLAYVMIDAIVDNYFVVLEAIADRLEDIEEELTGSPTPQTLQNVYAVKKALIFLRKSISPLREVMLALGRGTISFICEETRAYMHDTYEHAVRVVESIELHRDTVTSMLDLYLSGVSQRTNEIMKVLTIIATIFIPLTFISGLYGMNFNSEASPYNMPELNWRYGYFFALGLMALVSAALIAYFKRRNWL
jgi:magnesium transporter